MYALVVFSLWLAGGALAALWMKRCGHDVKPWIALGVAFGPFAIPYAIRCHRTRLYRARAGRAADREADAPAPDGQADGKFNQTVGAG